MLNYRINLLPKIFSKKAFRIPTHCHPLETFPESVSQSFLHGISDIRHLILVNVYIVRFDKFLKKKMIKILKCEMFPRCLKKSTIHVNNTWLSSKMQKMLLNFGELLGGVIETRRIQLNVLFAASWHLHAISFMHSYKDARD